MGKHNISFSMHRNLKAMRVLKFVEKQVYEKFYLSFFIKMHFLILTLNILNV